MCSYLHIRSAPWDSGAEESDHCLCGKHLPSGNPVPVRAHPTSPLGLLHRAMANSKREVSQNCVPWANRLTVGSMHL